MMNSPLLPKGTSYIKKWLRGQKQHPRACRATRKREIVLATPLGIDINDSFINPFFVAVFLEKRKKKTHRGNPSPQRRNVGQSNRVVKRLDGCLLGGDNGKGIGKRREGEHATGLVMLENERWRRC